MWRVTIMSSGYYAKECELDNQLLEDLEGLLDATDEVTVICNDLEDMEPHGVEVENIIILD